MRTFNITVNGQTYVVDVEEVGGVSLSLFSRDTSFTYDFIRFFEISFSAI